MIVNNLDKFSLNMIYEIIKTVWISYKTLGLL
jgi:hypothetical protein